MKQYLLLALVALSFGFSCAQKPIAINNKDVYWKKISSTSFSVTIDGYQYSSEQGDFKAITLGPNILLYFQKDNTHPYFLIRDFNGAVQNEDYMAERITYSANTSVIVRVIPSTSNSLPTWIISNGNVCEAKGTYYPDGFSWEQFQNLCTGAIVTVDKSDLQQGDWIPVPINKYTTDN